MAHHLARAAFPRSKTNWSRRRRVLSESQTCLSLQLKPILESDADVVFGTRFLGGGGHRSYAIGNLWVIEPSRHFRTYGSTSIRQPASVQNRLCHVQTGR